MRVAPRAPTHTLSEGTYATGRMGSRQIESASHTDVAVRYICGGDLHPDHDTICTFRRLNGALFSESFVKVLAYAQELGVLKKRGGVSVDGTKIAADASKYSAVSYQRAGEMIAELEKEVQELMALATTFHPPRSEDLKENKTSARQNTVLPGAFVCSPGRGSLGRTGALMYPRNRS